MKQLDSDFTVVFGKKDVLCILAGYYSLKGNAYGLENKLMQTTHLKPSVKIKKVNNLFYVRQLTVPGPEVPPSNISGKVSAHCSFNT